jgi:hypothetical protein
MNISEYELSGRRFNECAESVNYLTILHAHQRDSAGAVPRLIGSFKINGGKFHHKASMRASSIRRISSLAP